MEVNMGKNNGKGKRRTDIAKWESVMAKLDNYLAQEETERKKKTKEDLKNTLAKPKNKA